MISCYFFKYGLFCIGGSQIRLMHLIISLLAQNLLIRDTLSYEFACKVCQLEAKFITTISDPPISGIHGPKPVDRTGPGPKKI